MITVSEKTERFLISTAHSSYVMGVTKERFLTHLYYGKKIRDVGAEHLFSYVMGRGFAEATYEKHPDQGNYLNTLRQEYPVSGMGDFHETCLELRQNQAKVTLDLRYDHYEIRQDKAPLEGMPSAFGEGVETLIITLKDSVVPVTVELYYSVFADSDVICRHARILNETGKALYLEKALSANLYAEHVDGGYDMISLAGCWGREHIIERRKVGHGNMTTESYRGKSDHDGCPFFALTASGMPRQSGKTYGMQLVYSGDYLGKVERDCGDQIRGSLGIHPQEFTWKLEAGDFFETPEALLVYSEEGLQGMSLSFHDFLRQHIIRSPWQFKERPILINNWEATYFNFNEEKLLDIAKDAKAAGLDMLVCDDGWFGHHRDDPSGSLGDWFVDPKKFPEGFASYADKVHAMGLKVGLWFEPEMICELSDLYEAHPDWALCWPGREPVRCRNQWILDYSNPEVIENIYQQIATMVKTAKLDYIKWDMNRSIIDGHSAYLPEDRQGEIHHRHVLGVYALQGRLTEEFPDLLIENCSSGGGRFDAGMLYYSPQIWASDNMDPVERAEITAGTTLAFPISTLGAHMCKGVNDTTGRKLDLRSRSNMAMLGTFGVEMDITTLNPEEMEILGEQIKRYRKIQPLIESGEFRTLTRTAENGIYSAFQITNQEKTEGYLIYFIPMTKAATSPARLYLQGLKEEATYQVDKGDEILTLGGDFLMHAGLCLGMPRMDAYSEIWHFQAI